ncbi:MAG: hypothetical protein KIC67_15715 [Clostridium butyricum]|nr:hypothetical protein [Clostridium butyricum]
MMNSKRLEKIRKLINEKLKSAEYSRVMIKTYEGLYMLKGFPEYKISKLAILPDDTNYIYEDLSKNNVSIDDLVIVSDGKREPIIIVEDYGEC